MAEEKNTDIIISQESLSQFFFKNLSNVNKKSICPVPEEFILYTSEVLDKYALSQEFFELDSGKVQEKLVGPRILEADRLSNNERIEVYKDVGDTVLVLLGLFKKRVEKKLLTQNYYLKMARSAYFSMGHLDCNFYDIPDFYNLFASSLERTIAVVETMFKSSNYKSLENFLLHEGDESDFILLQNISKKVS